MQDLTDAFVELIRRAAALLPADMERALRKAREDEEAGSAAEGALDTILQNVEMSRAKSTPICQDTGTPIFTIHYPLGVSTRTLADQIRRACAIATEKGYLRPNAVDSLTGKNSGNNTGIDFPTMHFEEWDEEGLKVNLILKGGGCENVSTQYELPNTELGAGAPWMVCGGWCSMPCTRPRDSAARRACWASPSAVTGARRTSRASSFCCARRRHQRRAGRA